VKVNTQNFFFLGDMDDYVSLTDVKNLVIYIKYIYIERERVDAGIMGQGVLKDILLFCPHFLVSN